VKFPRDFRHGSVLRVSRDIFEKLEKE
jgi:hypothetical protein